MKDHNERVISEEHWNDPEDIHESCTWACMLCSAPDLIPDDEIQCEMIQHSNDPQLQDRYELVEVICRACWEAMSKNEHEDWTVYFDQVIEP